MTIFRNMNLFGRGFFRSGVGRTSFIFLLLLSLVLATLPRFVMAQNAPPPPQTYGQTPDNQPSDNQPTDDQAKNQPPAQDGQAPPYAQQTPEQLQRLVAPIALYPDSLVAQILAASTFPEEGVQA